MGFLDSILRKELAAREAMRLAVKGDIYLQNY